MIVYRSGNLLEDDAVMLVCPVNCKGVMGAGLAKQFMVRFPTASLEYINSAKSGYLSPGGVLVCSGDNALDMIAFVATKDHWRDPSQMEWIEDIVNLLAAIVDDGIPSIAIPAIGCGLGGLPYPDVNKLLVKAADRTPDTQWRVYDPH